MKIHLLTGFLGSGKTTAIWQAAQHLINQKIKTGIITNDQGNKLVDGGLFKHLDIPNREVVNGCFCCNYTELDANISSLAAEAATEVIFAESVGSCTDIVATVLKPLLKFRTDARVTVSTFADSRLLQMMLDNNANSFDESVRYIYLKQLEEASVIVINKVDLINEKQLSSLKTILAKRYGNKITLFQNSNNKTD
ncbi:MAG: GTP-binding protein, partial [Flavitalea sp.]